MKHKTLLTLIIFLLYFISAHTQQTLYYLQGDANYIRGLELLEKEKYSTAQHFFELSYDKYRNSETELRTLSQYYMAFCAVRLFNDDAEYLTVKFINDNPESPLINLANFNLAGYFYYILFFKRCRFLIDIPVNLGWKDYLYDSSYIPEVNKKEVAVVAYGIHPSHEEDVFSCISGR